MNARLYPAETRQVNERDRLVAIFIAGFEGQPDLADLSWAATRVLATAAALFHERGAAATSVRDLTRACGLSPGALYNHFPSKNDVLAVVVRHGHTRMRARLDAAVAGCSDPRQRLAAFVRAYVMGHLVAPELAQVARREYPHLSAEHHAAVVRQRRGIRRMLETILDDGAASGRFDLLGGAGAATGTAVMLLDLCSRTSEWFDRTRPAATEELVERYAATALRMVGAAAA